MLTGTANAEEDRLSRAVAMVGIPKVILECQTITASWRRGSLLMRIAAPAYGNKIYKESARLALSTISSLFDQTADRYSNRAPLGFIRR